jgi:hypothetical protein
MVIFGKRDRRTYIDVRKISDPGKSLLSYEGGDIVLGAFFIPKKSINFDKLIKRGFISKLSFKSDMIMLIFSHSYHLL